MTDRVPVTLDLDPSDIDRVRRFLRDSNSSWSTSDPIDAERNAMSLADIYRHRGASFDPQKDDPAAFVARWSKAPSEEEYVLALKLAVLQKTRLPPQCGWSKRALQEFAIKIEEGLQGPADTASSWVEAVQRRGRVYLTICVPRSNIPDDHIQMFALNSVNYDVIRSEDSGIGVHVRFRNNGKRMAFPEASRSRQSRKAQNYRFIIGPTQDFVAGYKVPVEATVEDGILRVRIRGLEPNERPKPSV